MYCKSTIVILSNLLFVFIIINNVSFINTSNCLGSYEYCSSSGSCVLNSANCGLCGKGQYLCPLSTTCVNNVADLINCDKTKGSLFDNTISIQSRIEWVINNLSIEEKI